MQEIGEAIGLTSPFTVHSHLNTLQRLGYLRRDPTKPRAIEVRWDPNSGAVMERRPVRYIPLVGDVAAGTDVLAEENVEELLPVPADFTGDGELFMLRVRGDSMIDAGILDGDYVIAVQQPVASNGDTVVAGIPGGEATVKKFSNVAARSPSRPRTRRWSRSRSTRTTSRSTAGSSPSCAGCSGHVLARWRERLSPAAWAAGAGHLGAAPAPRAAAIPSAWRTAVEPAGWRTAALSAARVIR